MAKLQAEQWKIWVRFVAEFFSGANFRLVMTPFLLRKRNMQPLTTLQCGDLEHL